MSIRDRIVALAKSYDGCHAGPASRARYLDLVGPGETETMRAYMALPKTSGCALVVRGLWRQLALFDLRLTPPYKIGLAVADVVSIARRNGAWVTDLSLRPEPGDVILVGGDPKADGGVEHVATVTACDGNALESVDGGQRDAAGNQCIATKVRTWEVRADGSVWDRSRKGTDPGSGAARRVRGWVSAVRLPFPDAVADTAPAELAPPTPRNHGGTPLERRPTLRRGDRGEYVAEWQRRIGTLPADGIFGAGTEGATKRWQTQQGLDADGIVGAKSWAAAIGG